MPVGVELVELHVLHGHTVAVRQRHAVTGQGVRVGGHLEHPAEAAGGHHHRGGPEDVQLTVRDAVRHDAADPALILDQVHHVVLVEEPDALLDALLV